MRRAVVELAFTICENLWPSGEPLGIDEAGRCRRRARTSTEVEGTSSIQRWMDTEPHFRRLGSPCQRDPV